MSSFAGVSVVTDTDKCTTFDVGADTDSGYDLLVVSDYARTVQETHNGHIIHSDTFWVGGIQWFIDYFPNGLDTSSADYISLSLGIVQDEQDTEEPVEVKFQFSFVDQVEYQNPTHIRATETYSFSNNDLYHSCHKFMKRDALEQSTHLNNDSFTIRCDIMICKDHNDQVVSDTMTDIGQHLHNLLQNKLGCVFAARSTVFMAQLFGPMKEGTTSTAAIQIKDMEAKVFAALLSFMYTDSFPKMEKDSNMEEEEEGAGEYILWLQDLFVAADRYDLQRLKFLCEENLSKRIGVSSVASILALAEQHQNHRLWETCLKFIQVQSPKSLEKVMASDGWKKITMTYPSVLNLLIAKLVSNQKDLKRNRDMM